MFRDRRFAQGHDCAPALVEAHKDCAAVMLAYALWWSPLRARQLGQQAHILGIHSETVGNIGQRDIAEPMCKPLPRDIASAPAQFAWLCTENICAGCLNVACVVARIAGGEVAALAG